MFGDVKRHVEELGGSSDLAEHLARVVWELVTNVCEHGAPTCSGNVTVEIEAARVRIRLPGTCFDSVARAEQPQARGLETAKHRLTCCGWRWSYRAVDGMNEVSLEATV